METKLIRSSPEDEAAIQHGIDLDPDAPEATDEDWARARPTREVMPELVELYLRSRGKQAAPTKIQVSLRLDADLVAKLRASGPGWQSRVNALLNSAMTDKP